MATRIAFSYWPRIAKLDEYLDIIDLPGIARGKRRTDTTGVLLAASAGGETILP
jgi:hypothetical protein